MTKSTFKKIEVVFWIVYILMPIFSGWMVYRPLPNEYDEKKHELLDSHHDECGLGGLQSCEVPDKWRDEETGKIYVLEQFTEHHRSEGRRIAITTFAYGLVGCTFFAFTRRRRTGQPFTKAFQKALMVNIIGSLFMYWIA